MPDPNKIEGGRWDRVLRSKFNLKGSGSTSARIAEDISPTFSFPYRLEDDYLIGDRLMFARGVSVALAGENPRVLLKNGSDNKLIILEKIIISPVAGGRLYFGMSSGAVPFIADIPVFVRDGRWGTLGVDVGIGTSRFQEAAVVGAPTPELQSFAQTSGELEYFPNVVLTPNDNAFLSNATVGTIVVSTWYWREHLMEPSEVA